MGIAPYRYLPARQGGEIFIASFAASLSRFCQLTIASVNTNQPAEGLGYELWPLFSDSRLRYISPAYCRKLVKAVRERNMQLLYIEHPYMGWMAIWIQALTRRGYIVHSHNIESSRWRSLHKWWWPILHAYEKWVHRKAQHSFFISQDDADAAVRLYGLNPERVSIAPYGVSPAPPLPDRNALRAQISARHQVAAGATLYYFNGALAYLPNQQAVLRIIHEIAPLLEKAAGFPYAILISGKGLPEDIVTKIAATNGRIIYTGFVDSPAEYLAAADIFINPVLEGGGVKTKVLEALAAHKTVVSTVSGAIGVNPAICGNKLKVVADGDWQQFVALMQQREDINTPTPPSFFAYHEQERIAREAIAIMEKIASPQD
jgi:glycosyltransferase involved in cell wall biosynthesis